jgi:hypothetical protein
MLGNAKALKRNYRDCKGILIGPSMAPRFCRRSDSVVVFFLTALRETLASGQFRGTDGKLTYALTIEDPYRFPKSREVGCFLGLRPGRRNRYLRTMMVQGAHYILGPFGEDSDLRR